MQNEAHKLCSTRRGAVKEAETAVARLPWSEHSPQEIVRRTRCMANETRDAVVWRDCCDLILERLGAHSEPPATAGAEGGPHAER